MTLETNANKENQTKTPPHQDKLEHFIRYYYRVGFKLFPVKTLKPQKGKTSFFGKESDFIKMTEEDLIKFHRKYNPMGLLGKHTGFIIFDSDNKISDDWFVSNILPYNENEIMFVVKTERGRHYYCILTDAQFKNIERQIKKAKKKDKGISIDILDEKKGVFIPGSWRADKNKVGWNYESGKLPVIENNYKAPEPKKRPPKKSSKTKSNEGNWPEGSRNETLNEKFHYALKENRLGDAKDILEKAEESGLPPEEISRTSQSVVEGLQNSGDMPKLKNSEEKKEISTHIKKELAPFLQKQTSYSQQKNTNVSGGEMPKDKIPKKEGPEDQALKETHKRIKEIIKAQYETSKIDNALIEAIARKKIHIKETKELNSRKPLWINPILAQYTFHLLAGEKNIGKTALVLNIIIAFLEKGKRCAFLLSSETSREERIDQFLKDSGFKEVPENLTISDNKFEIFSRLDEFDFLCIDDIHDCLILGGIIDNSKRLGWMNILARLYKITILGLGHQTKTSQKESHFSARGGGNMKLVTVPRVYMNLEKSTVEKTEDGKKNQFYGSPILTLMTNLPRIGEYKNVYTYVLNDDFKIKEPIKGDPQKNFEALVKGRNKYFGEVSVEKVEIVRSIIQKYGGVMFTTTLKEKIKKHKITPETLRKIYQILGCICTPEGGIGGRWVVKLPTLPLTTEQTQKTIEPQS